MKFHFLFYYIFVLFAFSAKSQPLKKETAMALMTKSGCMVCHAIDKTKIGPSYEEVSARYASPTEEVKAYLKGQSANDYLFSKVRKGTKVGVNKNWIKSKEGRPYGMMTPNPVGRLSDSDLKALLAFILSLTPAAK